MCSPCALTICQIIALGRDLRAADPERTFEHQLRTLALLLPAQVGIEAVARGRQCNASLELEVLQRLQLRTPLLPRC